MSKITLYHGDCLEILPTLEAGIIDAVITDPPYGIDWKPRVNNKTAMVGDDKPFDPRPFLCFGSLHLFWGGNYFSSKLPDESCWLMWLKHDEGLWGKRTYSPYELAWTDFGGTHKAIRHIWDGYIKQGIEHNTIQVHPSQKPVALMEWCLSFTPEGATILDPFMGSGTTGVACVQTGRNFIGIEIDKGYFDIAEKRIKEAQLQIRMEI